MESVQTLFKSIKRRVAEKTISTWPDYRDLLISLAKNEQVDPVAAAEVLEAANKTEAELEADVEKMTTRLTASTQFGQLAAAKKTRLAAERKAANLAEELRAANARLQPLIAAANAEHHAAQRTEATCNAAHGTLLRTCLDPEILAAEAELTERRSRIDQRRRQFLIEDSDENGDRSAASILAGLTPKIEELKTELKAAQKAAKTNQEIPKHYAELERDSIQSRLDEAEQQKKTLQERLAKGTAELETINAELKAIEATQKKLQDRKIKEL